MLGTAKVMSFVAASDPARALRFYRDVLGLRLVADEPSALVFDANGTMLRVQKVQRVVPAPFTVLGWDVADIRASIAALARAGVTFERFSGLPMDDANVWTAPDGTQVAWFKDPDGNVLSLTEFPRSEFPR